MASVSLAPILTPHGRLSLVEEDDAPVLDIDLAQRLRDAFARGAGHGLFQLGAGEVATALPLAFSYWRELGGRYVTALCTQPDTETSRQIPQVPPPPDAELARLALGAPVMTGAEYLTGAALQALWEEMDRAFRLELSESQCGVQDFLKRRNPAWNLVGRVHFNLAENRKDEEAPFAFLDLHDAIVSARQGAASSFGACRSSQRRPFVVSASSRATRGRKLSVAESHGGRGRDLERSELEQLLEQLLERRRIVRRLIEDFRTSSRNPFPHWHKDALADPISKSHERASQSPRLTR